MAATTRGYSVRVARHSQLCESHLQAEKRKTYVHVGSTLVALLRVLPGHFCDTARFVYCDLTAVIHWFVNARSGRELDYERHRVLLMTAGAHDYLDKEHSKCLIPSVVRAERS